MPTWEEVVAMASELPEVEESTWFRTPSLKVAGVQEAWRRKAPAKLRKEFDAR